MDNALLKYLGTHPRGREYAGKIQEITPIIGDWLAYTVQTFPHYTRHTISHSEKIVEQLSLLLFKNPSARNPKPVIPLTAIEVYILICTAYLHDAGMVISDRDKFEILNSDGWTRWITEEDGKERFDALQKFKSTTPQQNEQTNFSYNIELRQIIAEYVRRQHHIRAGVLVELNSDNMARFDFGDPSLRRTVADVCVAHGLDFSDLSDNDRFPERRTIRGEQANVKLLAILFRLGDLLDMGCDRACPSLTSAANPIPTESQPHWDQYTHIMHRSISPDAIEIGAECESQEEHRTLQNWCLWIDSECKNAANIVPHMSSHSNWTVPQVRTSIKPGKSASYIAKDWKFKFDEDKIIQRLIQDVHPNELGFINELLQNSLDAMRCRMYADLGIPTSGKTKNPWRISEVVRQNYPLKIEISKEEKFNNFSDSYDEILVISVDDSGIGMDEEVINNYFLQIGRSYYTSSDFQKTYSFQPISRFGVGFMSVFSKSNRVDVETYKVGSTPLKMTLEGPRNYFLLEFSKRNSPGTKVKVYLENSDIEADIVKYIDDLCQFVEFPIYVTHNNEVTQISSESPEEICYQIPDSKKTSNKFILKEFPVNTEFLYGSLYVLSYRTLTQEDWTQFYYAMYEYPKYSPSTNLPILPSDTISVNGLNTRRFSSYRDNNKITRIDVRAKISKISLDKKLSHLNDLERLGEREVWSDEVDKIWREILHEHLDEVKKRKSKLEMWKYLQRLPKLFPMNNFWEAIPGSIRIHYKGKQKFLSSCEFQEIEEFTTLFPYKEKNKIVGSTDYCLNASYQHSHFWRGKMFPNRSPVSISTDDNRQCILWRNKETSPYDDLLMIIKKEIYGGKNMVYIVPFSPENEFSTIIFKTLDDIYHPVILNFSNQFVNWLVDFSILIRSKQPISNELESGVSRLFKHHLDDTILSRYGFTKEKFIDLRDYLKELENMPTFPDIRKAPVDTLIKQIDQMAVIWHAKHRKYLLNF